MKLSKIKQSRTFTILGEPCSKANSRIMIVNKGKRRCIKNANAQAYVESFTNQVRFLNIQKFVGDVVLHCQIYYSSYRKDLDESLIMDCLQKSGVLENDRQIKEKHIYHAINKECPKTIITLETKQ